MHCIQSVSEIREAADSLRRLGSVPAWLTQDKIDKIAAGVTKKTSSEEKDELIANALCEWRASLNDQFNQASEVLAADFEKLDLENFDDRDGIVYNGLYTTERQYIETHKELREMRDSLAYERTDPLRGRHTRQALVELIELYRMIIGSIQEIRWSLQILEGASEQGDFPLVKSGTEFITALDESDST